MLTLPQGWRLVKSIDVHQLGVGIVKHMIILGDPEYEPKRIWESRDFHENVIKNYTFVHLLRF